MATDATTASFDQEVLSADGKVIVDFWAPWCGPCLAVAPVLDKIGAEKGVKIVKVNIDDEPELAMRFNIASIPAMAVFENGEKVAETVGAQPKAVLERSLGL